MLKKRSLIFVVYLLLTIAITYPVISNMGRYLYGPLHGTDMEASVWDFWWVKHAGDNGLSLSFCPFINYPFGVHSSSTYNISLSINVLLLKFFNEIETANIEILLSFILSSFFVYLLVYMFTKNTLAAFLSGLIYGFCPYHFAKSWEHLSLAQTQWIPLVFIFLFKIKQTPKAVYAALLGASLFIVGVFEYHYAIFVFLATGLFIVYEFIYERAKSIPALKVVFFGLVIGGCLSLLGAFSYLKQLFTISNTSEAAFTQTYVRPLSYLFAQSARPLSYFLPASAHPVFGNFTKSMFGTIFYGRGWIEQSLYLGWVPVLLSFVAYKTWRRRDKTKPLTNNNLAIGYFVILAILAFLFSMPPYFNLGLFKIYFPSFFMHKFLPMLRAYARFGVMVVLAVSVLAGFGFNYILQRLRSRKMRLALSILIISVVMFEFINIPPLRATDVSKVPKVYEWLAKQPGDFAIVEYPLGDATAGEASMPYNYLLWQRVHKKKLINGAKLGTPSFKIKKKINKITDKQTPGILKWLGAKYVIVHSDIYASGADRSAMDVIGKVPDVRKLPGFKFVGEFANIQVYEIIAEPIEVKID